MSPTPGTRTSPYALVLALGVWALLAWRFDFVCDDAYISFRYARHLVEGHGLVFNLGESPPVEGYTNFLWVLAMAGARAVGLPLELASRALSLACGALLVLLVLRSAARRLELSTGGQIATGLVFATLPPVAVWSTSGLETMAFALACFAAFERLALAPERPRPLAAGLCALAAGLLRADGALWAGAFIALAALGRDRARLRAGASACAILATGVAVHLSWRHGYYGEWVPNTARVKADLSALRLERGFDHLASLALAVPSLALVPLVALATRGRPDRDLALRCAGALAFAVGYAVFVGGDFMPMGRFLLPAMPFAALLFANAWKNLAARPLASASWTLACAGLALLACFDVPFAPASVRQRVHFRWNKPTAVSEVQMWRDMRERAQRWTQLARALAMHTAPGESIVLGNIGAIGYLTELQIHDVFGLTNPAVARRAGTAVRASPGHDKVVSPEFFIPLRPTYFTAFLAPAGAPMYAGLPVGWRQRSFADRLEIDARPLDREAGFPPDTELRLVRMRWDE